MTRWLDEPLLAVEHLTMRFGGLVAVDDLSFVVGRGDITALIGPNGAGKTTVFNCVTGFYKPTSGRLAFAREGKAAAADIEALTRSGRRHARMGSGDLYLLERMADHEIAREARVARTFQNIRLFQGMTVLENLIVARHNELMRASLMTVGGLVGLPSYARAERAAVEIATSWLKRIGLIDRADEPAGALPYGDQRRLEIARAMCAELNDLLLSIRERDAVSLLLIEHDMSVVMKISDHVIVLDYGRKIADGGAKQVRDDPAVIAAYLGVDDENDTAPAPGGAA